jgi:hypothetical protein
MFYDLGKLDLSEWHPRDIPEALLTNPELQKQQGFNLPPLEQWYVMILHNAVVPGSLIGKPSTAFSDSLLADARKAVPRLRELTAVGLRNFLTDAERLGAVCTKYRASIGNGWTFPPLAEARAAWAEKYGPTVWDREVEEWKKS